MKKNKKLDKIAELGCIVCKLYLDTYTPAEIHHIRKDMGMSMRNTDDMVLPLCPCHHRYGDGTKTFSGEYGFHKRPKKFIELYGTELQLLKEIKKLYD